MYPKRLEKKKPYMAAGNKAFEDEEELVRGFVKDNYNIGMHEQDFFEINIIVRGSGMHYIGESRIPVNRGDVFIIPPNTPHGYASVEGFDVYHLLLSQSFMQKYMADLQKLPSFFVLFAIEPLMRTGTSTPFHLTLTHAQLKNTEELMERIRDYSDVQSISSRVVRNSLAVVLITMFCEIYTEKGANNEDERNRHDAAFANALAFIYERYNEKISIADLAKIAHLSRSAFIRKFHEICKVSPAKFITQQRIEAAKHLLIHTALSIQEIAAKTGFYDTSHFIKTFTAETEMTPSVYRKEKEDGESAF